MKEELDAFLENVKVINNYKIFDLNFYECEYNDKACILVECGIGKVNAARCSQILIDNMNIDCIINVGVAGGISNELKIGDIVVALNLIQHDFDLCSFDHKKGYIPNAGDYFYCDDYLLNQSKLVDIKNIHFGTIASGDIFVTDKNMAKKINTKFGALCTEMEGASIAQVCHLAGIPFLVIRSISDTPNGNNNIDFDIFLKDSANISTIFIKKLLSLIA